MTGACAPRILFCVWFEGRPFSRASQTDDDIGALQFLGLESIADMDPYFLNRIHARVHGVAALWVCLQAQLLGFQLLVATIKGHALGHK